MSSQQYCVVKGLPSPLVIVWAEQKILQLKKDTTINLNNLSVMRNLNVLNKE